MKLRTTAFLKFGMHMPTSLELLTADGSDRPTVHGVLFVSLLHYTSFEKMISKTHDQINLLIMIMNIGIFVKFATIATL